MRERRALQGAVAVACVIPLAVGAIGVVQGPHFLARPPVVPTDLDSHFRYLSGVFLAIGIAFATCVPGIERKGARFRLLAALIVCGGLARLVSLAVAGTPSLGHLLGLAMELGVVPLLTLWQVRVAQRFPSIAGPASAAGA